MSSCGVCADRHTRTQESHRCGASQSPSRACFFHYLIISVDTRHMTSLPWNAGKGTSFPFLQASPKKEKKRKKPLTLGVKTKLHRISWHPELNRLRFLAGVYTIVSHSLSQLFTHKTWQQSIPAKPAPLGWKCLKFKIPILVGVGVYHVEWKTYKNSTGWFYCVFNSHLAASTRKKQTVHLWDTDY